MLKLMCYRLILVHLPHNTAIIYYMSLFPSVHRLVPSPKWLEADETFDQGQDLGIGGQQQIGKTKKNSGSNISRARS